MAFNFWEAQRRARSKTAIYLALFIALTAAMAALVEIAMRQLGPEVYHPPLPYLGIIFTLSSCSAALFNYWRVSALGGSYVAESLGATKVERATASDKQTALLNIVDEIAIAAALPPPPLYLLPSPQINAFAAGLSSEMAAIAITEGAVEQLSRDELQGVIAHEFGHIYNGDMKISMRLAAMVIGFFFLLYFSFRLLQFSTIRRTGRSNGKGQNPIALAAIIFIVAGAIMWLFGSLLKAAVSREREYLADACAVQFTRNPNGICNALRKIATKAPIGKMPKNGSAYSHLYFDDRTPFSGLFATHPPLQKRIAALEGKRYFPEEWKNDL